MSVEGFARVSIDLNDTHTEDSIDSLKKVVLSSSDTFTNGVVVVATGTCGTSAVSVDFSEFRGADGELVSWDSYGTSTRIAFAASPSAQLDWDNVSNLRLTSRNDDVAITSLPLGTLPLSPGPMEVKTVVGFGFPPPAPYTASYTVIMMQEA